ncbi:hypothetical protein [Dyella acidisoli]|uniref:hypothetical protein n=1 Tax=Dyella acidisoli TaxID=1867834 RepID=UPI0024E09100|nr:hypothetical protein [Dyella acidisoli]
MSPLFSLHRFAASRFLRVTALLAWLLMTVSLPAASTAAMGGEVHAAAGMTSMMMGHDMHVDAMVTDGHHVDHCCGDTAHPACHCDAMCGSVLLPSVPALFGPVRLADIHVPTRDVDAPTPDLIPPLRPPAV